MHRFFYYYFLSMVVVRMVFWLGGVDLGERSVDQGVAVGSALIFGGINAALLMKAEALALEHERVRTNHWYKAQYRKTRITLMKVISAAKPFAAEDDSADPAKLRAWITAAEKELL